MLMGNRENTPQKYESNLALGRRLVGIFLRGARST